MLSNSSLLSTPFYLWNLYVEHLWDYKSGSWVQRVASSLRILAFLMVTPFIILTLLDVASYVIARTLGVVDATKASTGERDAISVSEDEPPTIQIVAASPDQTCTDVDVDPSASSYFRDSVVEEGNPRLAGVDAFSPAPSQPPSPVQSRRDLHRDSPSIRPFTDLSGKVTRKRSSISSSSSGEISQENGDGVHMRRRAKGSSSG